MADTQEIQKTIDSLGESPEIDRVLLLMDKIQAIKDWLKKAEPLVKRHLIDRCAIAPVPVGDGKEWRFTRDKKVDCQNPAQVLDELLKICTGDMDKVCDHLGSNPWKYGAVKRTLEEFGKPELYGQLFTESWREDCVLKLVDRRFLRSAS